MKRMTAVFIVFCSLTGFSQRVSVSEARAIYFSMEKDHTAALTLYKIMNAEKQYLTPVLLAYKGATTAASAGQVNGVYNKLSYFKHGKADLEKAVQLDPGNPEIRFLRLATQTKAPGFLLYKGDIHGDKKIVIEGLPGLLARETDRPFALKIARSLMAFDSLTAREKQIVNQLCLHYEQNN